MMASIRAAMESVFIAGPEVRPSSSRSIEVQNASITARSPYSTCLRRPVSSRSRCLSAGSRPSATASST
jgi:hypothetical protein